MERDENSFFRIFAVYSHHSQHFSLDAAIQFARDFNICPQLFETAELISLYQKVFIENPIPPQITKKVEFYKVNLSISIPQNYFL